MLILICIISSLWMKYTEQITADTRNTFRSLYFIVHYAWIVCVLFVKQTWKHSVHKDTFCVRFEFPRYIGQVHFFNYAGVREALRTVQTSLNLQNKGETKLKLTISCCDIRWQNCHIYNILLINLELLVDFKNVQHTFGSDSDQFKTKPFVVGVKSCRLFGH